MDYHHESAIHFARRTCANLEPGQRHRPREAGA
jgi:hypothetical protein